MLNISQLSDYKRPIRCTPLVSSAHWSSAKHPLRINLVIRSIWNRIHLNLTSCCRCLQRNPVRSGPLQVLCLVKGQSVILSSTAHSIYSQLTSISEGRSPIRNLGSRCMEVLTSKIVQVIITVSAKVNQLSRIWELTII